MVSERLITRDSVILVTGGARGITARCVVRLAEQYQCKFILIGRTDIAKPLPKWAESPLDERGMKSAILEAAKKTGEKILPVEVEKRYRDILSKKEIADTLAEIRSAGGTVEYISADINQEEQLKGEIQRVVGVLGPVRGVIHGAGALADKLIEKKTSEDYDRVVSPKVTGFENIARAISVDQLKFIVLFSSVVGFYGNPGQADYAIANEILNRTAYLFKHKYPDCHVISIGWGPWDAGMVTPELKKAFELRQIDVIPVEVGAQMLVDELDNPHEEDTQLIVGSFPSFSPDLVDLDLKQYQIRRQLRLDANPFLFDHQIGDRPVLPATCAASWVVNLCEQLYPGYRFFSLSDFKVLKGIVFDETLAKEHILDLQETKKSIDGISFDAVVWSTNARGRKQFHYSLSVQLMKKVPTAPIGELPPAIISNELPQLSGLELYQTGILFHGPAFQGVERVININKTGMDVQCVLPRVDELVQGQFPVQSTNPYIYDAIVQCILIWAQHFYNAPCLPSRLARFEQYKPLPFDEPLRVHMAVASEAETSIVGNIIVQNQKGETCVRITQLEGTISRHLSRLFGNNK